MVSPILAFNPKNQSSFLIGNIKLKSLTRLGASCSSRVFSWHSLLVVPMVILADNAVHHESILLFCLKCQRQNHPFQQEELKAPWKPHLALYRHRLSHRLSPAHQTHAERLFPTPDRGFSCICDTPVFRLQPLLRTKFKIVASL